MRKPRIEIRTTVNTMASKKTAPRDLRDEVKRLVGECGDKAAAEAIGISRATVARVLAGLDLAPGTLALLRERFGATATGGNQ
jgi:hypothetical protein